MINKKYEISDDNNYYLYQQQQRQQIGGKPIKCGDGFRAFI